MGVLIIFRTQLNKTEQTTCSEKNHLARGGGGHGSHQNVDTQKESIKTLWEIMLNTEGLEKRYRFFSVKNIHF